MFQLKIKNILVHIPGANSLSLSVASLTCYPFHLEIVIFLTLL